MSATITTMKQLGLGLELSTKGTRKREFLDEMERVVPRATLVQVVEPNDPEAKAGRPPFDIETMMRIHYLRRGSRSSRTSIGCIMGN